MTDCFVDTSALYAVLDADDANHHHARPVWEELLASDALLVTTNYVLVETFALLRNRLGLTAVRRFQEDVHPLLHVVWLEREAHEAGIEAVLVAKQRRLSLVDCTSFHAMRRRGLQRAFAFDRHFEDQGFTLLPTVL